jgi:hypothetical protein
MKQRVGTAQRSQVLELLGRAFEEGYLDAGEYEQRVFHTTSARTVGELVGQVSDLPAQFQWSPDQPPPATTTTTTTTATARRASDTHASSVASLVLAIMSVPLAICYGIGALFGIAAVVLSRPGLRTGDNYGKALAGLVVGILGILCSVSILLLYLYLPGS